MSTHELSRGDAVRVTAKRKGLETHDIFVNEKPGQISIAEHARECDRHFKLCVESITALEPSTELEDQFGRFKLWTTNMGVFSAANISLDYRLRYSPTFVDIIHQLLSVLCNTLSTSEPYVQVASS
jgi:hypothetical protein